MIGAAGMHQLAISSPMEVVVFSRTGFSRLSTYPSSSLVTMTSDIHHQCVDLLLPLIRPEHKDEFSLLVNGTREVSHESVELSEEQKLLLAVYGHLYVALCGD